jgi:hypothetical protein
MTQMDKMLKIMLENKQIKKWSAKDFQSGEWFIGYEASARMSDLIRLYPDLFILERDGRFRILKINWKEKKMIKEIKKQLKKK